MKFWTTANSFRKQNHLKLVKDQRSFDGTSRSSFILTKFKWNCILSHMTYLRLSLKPEINQSILKWHENKCTYGNDIWNGSIHRETETRIIPLLFFIQFNLNDRVVTVTIADKSSYYNINKSAVQSLYQ